MTPHRLFFALSPPPAVRAQVERVVDALPRHGGRRSKPDKLHLTLAFLGDFEGEAGTRARAAACAAGAPATAACPAFDFVLDAADGFPGGIALLRASAEAFAPLRAALLAQLHAQGLHARDEGRAFVPHLTFLRGARERLPRSAIAPIPWRADELLLYDSQLDTGRYEVAGRWPLQ